MFNFLLLIVYELVLLLIIFIFIFFTIFFLQGAVIYKNLDALLQVSHNLPVGVLAYITDQDLMYLRVRDGWRVIQVCHILPLSQRILLIIYILNVISQRHDVKLSLKSIGFV